MQINPEIYKVFSILIVLLPAQLKLFLYGIIDSINSTIYVATYGGKNMNRIKAFRVLRYFFSVIFVSN